MTEAGLLGVGVVGLGVGEVHARAFAADPRCVLRWLYDPDRERAAALAAAVNDPGVADSFEQVLADPRVDIVAIASPDDVHFEQVMAALASRKHVFVEKPISRTLGELKRIKETLHESGRHLASNLILRAAPLYRWLFDAIQAGELGDIYAFDGDYLYGRLHKITDGWRRDVENYSVMMGGGIHLVDLMLWLTGERPVRATATGNRIATRGTAFRYRDFMAAQFDFPSGMVGRITANFGCVHRHQHVVRVFGTRATFIYDDAGARLHESRLPEAAARPVLLDSDAATKGDLIPPFVGRVLAGGGAGTAALDFDSVCVCTAAERAAEERHAVEITYV